MTTFVVTTTADRVDADDGRLSLREAVQQANAGPGADTIRFAPAVAGGTLVLTGGQLVLTDDALIDGGRRGVTLDGGGADRVLLIGGTGTEVGLDRLVVTGGDPDHDSQGGAAGGGLHVGAGNGVTLTRSTIAGNEGYAGGGGLFADTGSRVTIVDSTIADNRSGYCSGGGLATGGGVAVAILRSELSGNRAHEAGGAVSLVRGSSLVLERSTIAGNASQYGGGVLASASRLRLDASTVAGNSASYGGGTGGGIELAGAELVLRDSTVTGNLVRQTIATAGGIHAAAGPSGAASRLEIENSIVAGNFSEDDPAAGRRPFDVSGTVTLSNGHNVFGSEVGGSVAGDREGVDPGLVFAALDPATGGGQLALGGGPTRTAALADRPDNPALGGAEPLTADATDQRGAPRPQPADSAPDIGAFELRQTVVPATPSHGNDVPDGDAGTGLELRLDGPHLVAAGDFLL
jgi:CSLREA domain-containing protein